MSFEPQKLFIGLVDFFAIFLPGALLAYLGKNWGARTLLNYQSDFSLDSAQPLIIFLFVSYLLGHLIFLIGAYLDELIYDPLRRATRWGQIGRLANGKRLYPYPLRWLAQTDLLFGKNPDAAVMKAHSLKAKALGSAANTINDYQWCRALLCKQHPEGLVTVQRFEADSKFFRSFVIVLLILTPFAFYKEFWLGLVCLGLLVPALLRYIDQRFKGTQYAYWLVITLESQKPQPIPGPPKRDGLTHAGGVVYKNGNAVQYLLVESSNKKDWVLPKGHIEPGENMRETAVREVLEETRCWARVKKWIDDANLGTEQKPAETRLFLMEFLEEVKQKKSETIRNEDRLTHWSEFDAAKQKASFQQTKAVLAALKKAPESQPSSSAQALVCVNSDGGFEKPFSR